MTSNLDLIQKRLDALEAWRAAHRQLGPTLEMQSRIAPIIEAQRLAAPALALQEAVRPLKALQDAMRPLTELQDAMRPFKDLQEQWRGVVFHPPEWMEQLRQSADAYARMVAPFQESLRAANVAFQPQLEQIQRAGSTRRGIEKAGWLPHYTMPLGVLEDAEEESFDDIISGHYAENWDAVRSTFETNISGYAIDDDAKQAFREALDAHERKAYRSVSRTLFPEIERVARQDVHGKLKGETSQRALKAAAGELDLWDVKPRGLYGFALFNKLFDHLYARVETSEEIAIVEADPVPNRHAALHGIVAYDSFKSSINMLVMADFMFQVICAVKAQQCAAEGEAA